MHIRRAERGVASVPAAFAIHAGLTRRFPYFANYRIILQDSKEHLMAEKLTWDDAEKIGVLLARKHPELCPLSTDSEELRQRITDLAEFNDDSTACDQKKLETIRAAWNEELLDRTQ
jgi:FeS assembly protein IscX